MARLLAKGRRVHDPAQPSISWVGWAWIRLTEEEAARLAIHDGAYTEWTDSTVRDLCSQAGLTLMTPYYKDETDYFVSAPWYTLKGTSLLVTQSGDK